jgi:hypothetical protein
MVKWVREWVFTRKRQLHRIEFDRFFANFSPIVLTPWNMLEYVKQLTEI